MSDSEINQWEKAYFRQQADAAVGRLFRGLLHNLNGIVQAFSMQSELFALTFQQASKLLAEDVSEDDLRQRIARVRTTLESRVKVGEQMREKVQAAQDLLHRARLLPAFTSGGPDSTVADLIRIEVDFRQADMFFKHQVEKEVRLADGLPFIRRLALELHQAISALLANGAEALQSGAGKPRLLIEAKAEGGVLRLSVEDNGPGIPAADLPRIFDPFFTTKPGHDGVGLYLVKKMMAGCGGEVLCASRPGATRFELVLPEENI
ncbi:MAG: sensor histidine kinase [Desulfobacteraceae bacterium]|nr:sensor histidine kinase [Desulfobacteraceae bacterium]